MATAEEDRLSFRQRQHIAPFRRPAIGRAIATVLVRDDATPGVSYVGKFAFSPLENAVDPPMMFKVRKALDEGGRFCVRLNGQEDVDPEAAHQTVGKRGVMYRDDAVMPPAPKARIPGNRSQ